MSEIRIAAMTDAVSRLNSVRAVINAACVSAHRNVQDVTLVAVSKTYPAEAILPVLSHGHRTFGENYVQESLSKWPALKASFPDTRLHMIGPLQSNKAREAVGLFDVIETLDRPSLAREIACESQRQGRVPTLLVQVNTGEEPQKGGVLPGDVDRFIDECRSVHHLTISGLMAIPPADQPPAPHFALLTTIARRHGLATLSMGMSADFEIAVAMGATHVRVGSAIFGERLPRP
jgi:hypothetical protein